MSTFNMKLNLYMESTSDNQLPDCITFGKQYPERICLKPWERWETRPCIRCKELLRKRSQFNQKPWEKGFIRTDRDKN